MVQACRRNGLSMVVVHVNDLSMMHCRNNEMSTVVMRNERRNFVSVNDAQWSLRSFSSKMHIDAHGAGSESIEWFIEDQAILSLYDSAPFYPPPHTLLSASCLSFSVFLCVSPVELTDGRVGGKAKLYDGEKAWSSIKHSILPVQDKRAVDGCALSGRTIQGRRGLLPQLFRERAQSHQVPQMKQIPVRFNVLFKGTRQRESFLSCLLNQLLIKLSWICRFLVSLNRRR